MKHFVLLFPLSLVTIIIGCPSKEPKDAKKEVKQESPQRSSALIPAFQVTTHGFSFENYGNDEGVTNLTPAAVEELCGKGTCARGSGNTCQLSGAMRSFMDENNRSMSGGHCDGIAVVAQSIHMGKIPLSRYSRNALSAYNLPHSAQNLQSDIAKFFTTQSMEPSRSSELRMSPTQVLSTIKQQKESYTIGLYNHDGSNGHSVTAAKVIDDDARFSRIQIYDNNYPGQWRYIKVDKSYNSWDYEDYDTGDARSKTLTLIPLSSRFAPQQCAAEGNDDDYYEDDDAQNHDGYDSNNQDDYYEDDEAQSDYGNDSNNQDDYWDDENYEDDDYYRNRHHLKGHHLKDPDKSPWTVWLDGPGKLNVAPGTKSFPRRSPFKNKSLTPVYELVANKDNVVGVIGDQPNDNETTNVAMFRHGQSLVVEGIVLSNNEQDVIKLGKSGNLLEYQTKDKEAVTIRVGETYKGADYEIKISPIGGESSGYKFALKNVVDPSKGNHELLLRINNPSKKTTSFSIEMTRIDETDEIFTSKDSKVLAISNDETLHVEYGKWKKDKQPLLILSDKDDNGTIETVKKVKDDN